ncbi:hypothetical protein [Runella sp.]|jgi:hypothetical protein|uniref:hypothetical protein n=1 Tax=Runella sp. TaxID=1960881 RepID=UPI003019DB0E
MYQKFLLLVFSGLVSINAFSQSSNSELTNVTRDMINLGGMRIPTNGNGTLFGIKGPRGNVVGNPYLDSTWHTGSIKLFQKIGPLGREGDSIANVPLRLDLHSNEVEVQVNNTKEIRAVSGNQVRFFTIEGAERRVFMSTRQFRSEDNLQGFVELVLQGRISLVEYAKLNIIKPSYNEALGTGTKDTKITKSIQFYVVKGNTLFPIGASRKKLLESMGDRADDVEKFIKSNDLSLKSRGDMAKIFTYYNSL